ncbi:MAG TPA: hypothetical protein VGR73_03520 [Bryobacteraceae bacterium]|nr:hypothetical protein [Bryobacteraceae bacterium]
MLDNWGAPAHSSGPANPQVAGTTHVPCDALIAVETVPDIQAYWAAGTPPRFNALPAVAAFTAFVAFVADAAAPVMLIAAVTGLMLAGEIAVRPEPLPVTAVAASVPFTVWLPVNVFEPLREDGQSAICIDVKFKRSNVASEILWTQDVTLVGGDRRHSVYPSAKVCWADRDGVNGGAG